MWKFSTAIACALCVSSITAFAGTTTFDDPLPGWAAHDQAGSARLDVLPDVLNSGVSQAAAQLAGLSFAGRAKDGHDLGWIWASALNDAGNRRRVKAMFDAHIPVLVLDAGSSESTLRAVSVVFGFATPRRAETNSSL